MNSILDRRLPSLLLILDVIVLPLSNRWSYSCCFIVAKVGFQSWIINNRSICSSPVFIASLWLESILSLITHIRVLILLLILNWFILRIRLSNLDILMCLSFILLVLTLSLILASVLITFLLSRGFNWVCYQDLNLFYLIWNRWSCSLFISERIIVENSIFNQSNISLSWVADIKILKGKAW